MNTIPEILAPAGSYESMVAAVNAGCDAVYVGGKQFSARAYASNFETEELLNAIDYCHLRGVKIYLTVNTLFKEKEIAPLMDYVNAMYSRGIDALILQDFGTAKHIRKHFKDLELHASTQMTVHHLRGVEFLREQGFQRVVLHREASLEEVSHILRHSDMEIECFVHGALCYAYSGQCLMSSILGGRSGNRGRCAGTCRLPYNMLEDSKKIKQKYGHYLLSPKDIATLDLIPELMETGIHSYKIEGRMKSPEYVAAVTSMYRKYVDRYKADPKGYRVEDSDRKMLLELYNRGGFSKGYYVEGKQQIMSMKKANHQGMQIGKVASINPKQRQIKVKVSEEVRKGDTIEIWTGQEPIPRVNIPVNSVDGILTVKMDTRNIQKGQQVYRTRNQQTYNVMREEVIRGQRKNRVSCQVEMMKDKPLRLMLTYGDFYIYQEGGVVQEARKQSLSEERLRSQLMKTGSYPFQMDITQVTMDGDSFIPISLINQVRRDALDQLSEVILEAYRRPEVSIEEHRAIKGKRQTCCPSLYTLIRSQRQYEVIRQYPVVGVYLESEFFSLDDMKTIIRDAKTRKLKVYIALPRIYHQEEEQKYGQLYRDMMHTDSDGFLIRTYGEFQLLEKAKVEKIIDYNMNVFNHYTIDAWKKIGATGVTLSPELHHREIEAITTEESELLLYGYLPLMITKQCVVNNATRDKALCYNKKKYALNDRYNKNFYVDRRCDRCMNVIYNSSPMLLLDQIERIADYGIERLRLEFTTESTDQIDALLALTFQILKGKKMSTEAILEALAMKDFNRGHFMRGTL